MRPPVFCMSAPATASGTNLWTVTEGTGTDPATGGRVVFFGDQATLD